MSASAMDRLRALPGFKAVGKDKWEARCPGHEDREPSLSIGLGADGRILLHCHAGCELGRILGAAGVTAAELFPGNGNGHNPDKGGNYSHTAPKKEYWQRVWEETIPLDSNEANPGRLYLAQRGLSIEHLPADVRFHRNLPFFSGNGSKETIGNFPALVALVRDAGGKPKAIQRTYLTLEGRKADVPEPKKSCGPVSGGAVWLSPATDSANLAEGLETAWSVWQATGQPTCAVLGTSGMKAFEIPPNIKTLDIWADGDRNGAGETAAKELLTRGHERGLTTYLRIPGPIPEGKSKVDWNDLGEDAVQAEMEHGEPWEPPELEASQETVQAPTWTLWDASGITTWPSEPLIWSVENLIPRGGIGFMSAAPKDRKSLLTLDLALHLGQPASSRLWLGKFACTPARLLYIAREDPQRRIKERALEICQSYQLPLPEPNRLQFLIRERISLTDVLHLDWLKRQVAQHGFDFLILDVLNRMIPDLDELSAKDMAKLVSILEELNRDLGLTILCDDHTRKPQGKNTGRDNQEPNPWDLKGSIAKYGCADFMICLSRTPQDNRMMVYVENKDTDERPMFLVDVSPKGSAQPKFSWAGSVEKLANDMKAIGDGNREKVFQALSNAEWRGPKDLCEQIGMSRSTVAKHLASLFEAGRIEREGNSRNTRYRIIFNRDEYEPQTNTRNWSNGND